ncbi:MAG TPA: ABC transporter permease [Caldilineaceae bacterium]|nr:ABC transporter permease [Caldilineaceae bacterium]
MQRYILRRLVIAVPTLIGITILIFLAMRILPGDPLAMLTSESTGTYVLSEAELAAARASLGLDQPYPLQYLNWMKQVLSGDLGTSFWTKEPIRDLIVRRGPITAQIALMAVVFSWLIGVPIGMLSALWRNTWFDHLSRVGITVFIAVPSFWIGLLIILASVLIFTWRPPLTIIQLWEDPGANLAMTSLPALALGLGLAASTARMARSSALEVLYEDYVRTARAKGLAMTAVMWRHVFKNAMLPVITTSGLALGGLLGGAVSVERAFGVPGLGSLLVQALTERDWMMIQNLVLIYGVIFAVVNLLVDISYGYFDPRIRYE